MSSGISMCSVVLARMNSPGWRMNGLSSEICSISVRSVVSWRMSMKGFTGIAEDKDLVVEVDVDAGGLDI